MKKQDCFYLGKIIKKYSFKGEVLIKIDGNLSEDYFNLKNVLIENDKNLVPFFIKNIKLHKPDILRIKFEDIDSEELANKILNISKEKNADIITTEKDVVRLNHTKEGSYRKELSLKSNIAKLNIELDENYLIGLIEHGLNISH